MADLIGGLLGYMKDPRRTQQMQALAGLLTSANERAKGFNELNRAATDEFLHTKDIYGPKAQQLAKTLADAYNPIGLTVFHGSPAKFSKFDPTKIGSGEGAQAYGYGHYVAESPAVAKEYRDKLTVGENYVNGELFDAYNPKHYLASALSENSGNVAEAKDFLEFMASSGGSKSIKETAQSALDLLKKGESPKLEYVKPSGSFYEIDLPDEQIARMLDFDKPLMQQSKEIQSLAKQYGLTDADHMGGDLIAAMDAKRAAGAELMRQSGVPGIRYLDQGSRGTGEGTSNFVVFPGNEGLLTILKRNNSLLDD